MHFLAKFQILLPFFRALKAIIKIVSVEKRIQVENRRFISNEGQCVVVEILLALGRGACTEYCSNQDDEDGGES